MECPSENELVQYRGAPEAPGAELVDRHLASCDGCREVVFALSSADVKGAQSDACAQLTSGNTLGRFEIKGELGRGTMGIVYEAWDPALGRAVAIKVRARTSRLEVGEELRLQREAHSLAQLSHNNIVGVYEAGSDDGRVYVVMELIDGPTLGAWCDEAQPSVEQILAAFVQAGRGLQAAHDAHLIHRDFKPQNAMLTAGGQVKVADFGLVCAATAPLETNPSEHLSVGLSQTGALIGTPVYMAPEQLLGKAATAASDQFSFCVSLYEALYDTRPYAPRSDKHVASDFQQPLGFPSKPPLPAKVRRALARGLALDPDARFDSLARLLRHLEPRASRPKTAKLAMAAGLGALVVGGVAVGIASPDSAKPSSSPTEAEELMHFMVEELPETLDRAGQLQLQEQVARKATTYFKDRPIDWSRHEDVDNRAHAYENLGAVLRDQGKLEQASTPLATALDLRLGLAEQAPNNREFQADLAELHATFGGIAASEGDINSSLSQHLSALGIQRLLLKSAPNDTGAQLGLIKSHLSIGQAYMVLGRVDDAQESVDESVRRAQRLVTQSPDNAVWKRELAVGYDSLGDLHRMKGDLDSSLKVHRDALSLHRRLSEQEPSDAVLLRDVTISLENIGEVLRLNNDLQGSAEATQQSLQIVETLAAQDPTNAYRKRDVLITKSRLGDTLRASHKHEEALAYYTEALATAQALASDDPNNIMWQQDVLVSQNKVGDIRSSLGEHDAALENYRAAQQAAFRQSAIDPDNARWLRDVSVSHAKMSDVLHARGELAAALDERTKSIEVVAALLTQDQNNALWQRDLAIGYLMQASLTRDQGRNSEARVIFAQCQTAYQSFEGSVWDDYNAACCSAQSGSIDKAFDRMDSAVAKGFKDHAGAGADLDLAPLRGDRRWKRLLRSMR